MSNEYEEYFDGYSSLSSFEEKCNSSEEEEEEDEADKWLVLDFSNDDDSLRGLLEDNQHATRVEIYFPYPDAQRSDEEFVSWFRSIGLHFTHMASVKFHGGIPFPASAISEILSLSATRLTELKWQVREVSGTREEKILALDRLTGCNNLRDLVFESCAGLNSERTSLDLELEGFAFTKFMRMENLRALNLAEFRQELFEDDFVEFCSKSSGKKETPGHDKPLLRLELFAMSLTHNGLKAILGADSRIWSLGLCEVDTIDVEMNLENFGVNDTLKTLEIDKDSIESVQVCAGLIKSNLLRPKKVIFTHLNANAQYIVDAALSESTFVETVIFEECFFADTNNRERLKVDLAPFIEGISQYRSIKHGVLRIKDYGRCFRGLALDNYVVDKHQERFRTLETKLENKSIRLESFVIKHDRMTRGLPTLTLDMLSAFSSRAGFLADVNKAGRIQLENNIFDNKAWVDAVMDNKDNTSLSYYFLRTNPSLYFGSDKRQRKRKRLCDSNKLV